MQIVLYIISAAAAYIIGSVSASIFLSKHFLGADVRSEGSGNAGATNMARVFGLSFGFVTLFCDFLKAILAIWLCHWLLGEWGIFVGGFMCLVGHCFPVMYGFKGGKGISVGAAIALAIDWRVFLFVILTFLLGAFVSRKVSVGSVLATLGITVASIIFGVSLPRLLLAIFGMILVLWRHKENIIRVFNGTEPDFKPRKKNEGEKNTPAT